MSSCLKEKTRTDCVEDGDNGNGALNLETFSFSKDRYGGVIAKANSEPATLSPSRFDAELKKKIEEWSNQAVRGVWLTIPIESAVYVGVACKQGFEFHHAKPNYVLLTLWLLKNEPSTLPKYGFTQIGVGAVVVNNKNQVLMVQERVSPSPLYQGSWKFPGGLADPGESFHETAKREVMEETKIEATCVGVVSLRHSHNYRFGQGDIYVVVKMTYEGTTTCDGGISFCKTELQSAKWMDWEEVEQLKVTTQDMKDLKSMDNRISATNYNVLKQAMGCNIIQGIEIQSLRKDTKSSVLYSS